MFIENNVLGTSAPMHAIVFGGSSPEIPSHQNDTMNDNRNSQSPFFNGPSSRINTNHRGSDKNSECNEGKKFISPFDPEATIPLPYQLDELGFESTNMFWKINFYGEVFRNLGTTVWKRNERERYRVRFEYEIAF